MIEILSCLCVLIVFTVLPNLKLNLEDYQKSKKKQTSTPKKPPSIKTTLINYNKNKPLPLANPSPSPNSTSGPAFTFRSWNGEHFDDKTQTWQKVPANVWWDPEENKYKVGVAPYKTDPRLRFFYWYYEFILNTDNYAHPEPLDEIHKEWTVKAESGYKRLIQLCPRDHFKTALLNIGHMCYYACEKPDIAKVGLFNMSWDQGLAETTYFSVKQNLMDNIRIKSFYGTIIDEKRPCTLLKSYFTYQPLGAKPGLFCAPLKAGRITGTHPLAVWLDDIADEQFSAALMKKFQTILQRKLIPAVGRNGFIFTTGTIKGYNDENDPYLYLETIPTFRVFRYPASNEFPTEQDFTFALKSRVMLDEFGHSVIGYDGKPITEIYFEVNVKDRDRYKTIYPKRYQIEDLVIKYLEIIIKKKKSAGTFFSEYYLKAANPSGNFFNLERVQTLPNPEFPNLDTLKAYLKLHNIFTKLWIDPGGKGGHGAAIAVMAYDLERSRFFIIELHVVRAGIIEVARVCCDLILGWNIRTWGCEGNYTQKELYGDTLNREILAELKRRAREDHYSANQGKNNTGDKILRLQGCFSSMLGIDGTPIRVFVNSLSEGFGQFMDEITAFPDLPTGVDVKHEFDLLDAVCSIDIHLSISNFFFVDGAVSLNPI